MILKTLFVRFYKSFNFDYLRKFHPESMPYPWESLDESLWYPYVRVAVDPEITTIVGANESGKSHLLTAIEKGISGEDLTRQDFCRYSEFHTVEEGKRRWSDFGFEWGELSDAEREVISELCGLSGTSLDRFLLFRNDRTALSIYVPSGSGEFAKHDLSDDASKQILSILPRVFRIKSDVGIPDSLPMRWLVDHKDLEGASSLALLRRRQRFDLLESVDGLVQNQAWFSTADSVNKHASEISTAMTPVLAASKPPKGSAAKGADSAEAELMKKLLFDVARLDRDVIVDLHHAVRDGQDGHANGLIQKINNHLAATLNFPRWWTQDRDVRLVVTAREHDLVFTIRDRTGTEYSFDERSDGLKFFLSYYIQYRAHKPPADSSEILLMDEPDTYLSADAQQDLLKIFRAFADPDDDTTPVQVIYVTHSPFLIDRNHAERIRVLEKGVRDEGTRVVRDAARNHYEPLRSAFGAFVGEMTFIGHCNIIVEGGADQILLAGMATHLRAGKVSALETLDLNRVTIVPAGSAPHIPYLVYLARGRDIEQPAVIVLMDSDKAGDRARKQLQRGGAYNRQLLKDEYVIQIHDLKSLKGFSAPQLLVETEDLVPIPLLVRAAQGFLKEVVGIAAEDVARLTPEAVEGQMKDSTTVFGALATAVGEVIDDDVDLTKMGIARYTIEVVKSETRRLDETDAELRRRITELEERFRLLFRRLNDVQRKAERDRMVTRVSARIERTKKAFLDDHPDSATKERAHILLEDMEAVLDDESPESDPVRFAIQKVRREFALDVDMTEQITEYPKFRAALDAIQYAARHATQDDGMTLLAMAPEPIAQEAGAQDQSTEIEGKSTKQ